jgi:hypothetical protein
MTAPHDPLPTPPREPIRYDTKVNVTCAEPDCTNPLPATGTGRPARFCSPACRVRAHRTRQRDQRELLSVEVDRGSTSSKSRPPDQTWIVKIRCGQRSAIVAIGLRLHAAMSLAEHIADVVGTPPPTRPS